MTAPIYRDAHGRFVSLPPEARAKLEAMRQKVWYEDCGGTLWGAVVDDLTPTGEIYRRPYCDQVYRPERKGWLERAIRWVTWNRSRA